MTKYTNCEIFHCSMERRSLHVDVPHAEHLTVTDKPKYPIIGYGIDICHGGCVHLPECNP